jgi:hypothetical protein
VGEKVRYISRRDGKSTEQLIPISKGFPDLSVLVIRSGFIMLNKSSHDPIQSALSNNYRL